MRMINIVVFTLIAFGCFRSLEAVEYPKQTDLKPVFAEAFKLIRSVERFEKLEDRTDALHVILDAQVATGFGDEALETVRLLANRPKSPNKPHQVRMYGTLARAYILRGDSLDEALKMIDEALVEAKKIEDLDSRENSQETMLKLAGGALFRYCKAGEIGEEEKVKLAKFANELLDRILKVELFPEAKDELIFALGGILLYLGETDWGEKAFPFFSEDYNRQEARTIILTHLLDVFIESDEEKDYNDFLQKTYDYVREETESDEEDEEMSEHLPGQVLSGIAIERFVEAGKFEYANRLAIQNAENGVESYWGEIGLAFVHLGAERIEQADKIVIAVSENISKQSMYDQINLYRELFFFLTYRNDEKLIDKLAPNLLANLKQLKEKCDDEDEKALMESFEKLFAFISDKDAKTEEEIVKSVNEVLVSLESVPSYHHDDTISIGLSFSDFLKKKGYEKQADVMFEKVTDYLVDKLGQGMGSWYLTEFQGRCFELGNYSDLPGVIEKIAERAPGTQDVNNEGELLSFFPRNYIEEIFLDAYLCDILCNHIERRMACTTEKFVEDGNSHLRPQPLNGESLLKNLAEIDLAKVHPYSIVSLAFLQARLGDAKAGMKTLEHEKIPELERYFGILAIIAKDYTIKWHRKMLVDSGETATLDLPLMDEDAVDECLKILRAECAKKLASDDPEIREIGKFLCALIVRFETGMERFDEAAEDVRKFDLCEKSDYRKIMLDIAVCSKKIEYEIARPDFSEERKKELGVFVRESIEKWKKEFFDILKEYGTDCNNVTYGLDHPGCNSTTVPCRILHFEREMLELGIISDDPDQPFRRTAFDFLNENIEDASIIADHLQESGWYDLALRKVLLVRDSSIRGTTLIRTLMKISESMQKERVDENPERKRTEPEKISRNSGGEIQRNDSFDNIWGSFHIPSLDMEIMRHFSIAEDYNSCGCGDFTEFPDVPFWDRSSFEKGFEDDERRSGNW